MASNSLKIVDNNGINEAGYINVVKEIVLSADGFAEFTGEEDDDGKFTKARAWILRRLAKDVGGRLEQRDENDNPIRVNGNNCRIRAKPDKRKEANGFSKVTVTMPETSMTLADLTYIDDYIIKFLQIWTGATAPVALPAPASNAAAENARMFALGMMMLTRCR